MKQFKRKVYLLFFALFFLVFFVSCLGLFNIYQIYKENQHLQFESTEISKTALELEYMTSKLNFLGQRHILTKDSNQMNKYNKEIESTHQNLENLFNEIAASYKSREHNDDYVAFIEKWETYWDIYNQAIQYSQMNNNSESQKWLSKANSEYEELKSSYLQPLIRKYYKFYTELLETENKNFQDFLWTGINLLIVSFIGLILTFYYLQRILKESAQLRNKLEFLAFHDELTDLPNRRLFQNKVMELINEAPKKFALMYLDIDNFKYVNDNFGHDVGDLVIKAFAKRIIGCIPDTDILARQGGDEFTILLKNVSNEEINEFTNRIIQLFEQPINVSGQIFYISTSIGIAIYPSNGKNYLKLLKNSDDALYEAKVERNTFKISDRFN